MDTLIADGPLLILGGPYSNVQAFEAVLAEAARRGITPDHVVCTGDVVAYGADAEPCAQLARLSGIRVVMGNCEEALAAGADGCGCGFAPGSACDRLAGAWFAHADGQLSAESRAWMAGLPHRLDIAINGLRLAAIHGALDAISRFVFASTPARVKRLDLDRSGCDGIIAGHSGLPFSQVIGGRLWHNAGAAGMPANDATPRVWFSVLSPGAEQGTLAIAHHALAYPHRAAAAAMREARLPDGYAEALETGLWPSCDALPPAELKTAGVALTPGTLLWQRGKSADHGAAWPAPADAPALAPEKFRDPARTAKGEPRASVSLQAVRTLWINTGTLCNLSCTSCYIESTPRNDRLAYIAAADVRTYLDEIERDGHATHTIGFTGGEPFMNRELLAMLEDVLSRGLRALVLTNAMKPMQRATRALLGLRDRYGDRLTIRVSLDHYTRALHELERGPRSWQPTIDGLQWLAQKGFSLNVAGRLYSGEAEPILRAGYARLMAELGVAIDCADPLQLVLFPEMDAAADVPEITESCWDILRKSPHDVMCATSRMVVRRKGADRPAVLACTLLAYDPRFELGATLREATGAVPLNHPHCAKFCVLGGAACSAPG